MDVTEFAIEVAGEHLPAGVTWDRVADLLERHGRADDARLVRARTGPLRWADLAPLRADHGSAVEFLHPAFGRVPLPPRGRQIRTLLRVLYRTRGGWINSCYARGVFPPAGGVGPALLDVCVRPYDAKGPSAWTQGVELWQVAAWEEVPA